MSDQADTNEMLVTLTADIVAAHVSNNSVAISDLSLLINNVHAALTGLGSAPVIEEKLVPAVSIRSSVKPDFITCLEDGKKLKMLRRHLMTHYGMTPDDYRTKWGLPADYPMVAPDYAAKRKELAVRIDRTAAAALGVPASRVFKTREVFSPSTPWPTPV